MIRTNVTFRATEKEIELMDELATKMDVSRSEMVRRLVENERRARGLTDVDRGLWQRLAAYGADAIEVRARRLEGLDPDLAGFSIGVFAIADRDEEWLSPEAVSLLSEPDEGDQTLRISLGIPGRAGSVYLGRLPLRHEASLRVELNRTT